MFHGHTGMLGECAPGFSPLLPRDTGPYFLCQQSFIKPFHYVRNSKVKDRLGTECQQLYSSASTHCTRQIKQLNHQGNAYPSLSWHAVCLWHGSLCLGDPQFTVWHEYPCHVSFLIFVLWWLLGSRELLLPQLSVMDVPNECWTLVRQMTPQAVRRKEAYHGNSIESSWIVSEISLSHVKQIIPRAIWVDGGHYSKAYSYQYLYSHRAITVLCWCFCQQAVYWPAWC